MKLPSSSAASTTATEFRVRTYGRTELALLYSPDLTPGSAWRRLKDWIYRHPRLIVDLHNEGYRDEQRTFDPQHVRLIIRDLGEPF